jgi:hypothetical protein
MAHLPCAAGALMAARALPLRCTAGAIEGRAWSWLCLYCLGPSLPQAMPSIYRQATLNANGIPTPPAPQAFSTQALRVDPGRADFVSLARPQFNPSARELRNPTS